MRKVKFAVLGLLFFSFASGIYAYDNHDFQVWNTDILEWSVSKKLKIAYEQEFRWMDNAGEFSYQHYDIGLSYRLNQNWGLGAGYRDVYELSGNKWRQSNEPFLTATLFLEKFGFSFDSRSRLEYRNFDFKTDSWRYRNIFTLKFPWKFTKLELRPYISDEILAPFASAGTTQINQNRFSAGLGMSLLKNLKAELYYMLKSDKGSNGKWIDANILGTRLKLAF